MIGARRTPSGCWLGGGILFALNVTCESGAGKADIAQFDEPPLKVFR
jgi:hypothetical protein